MSSGPGDFNVLNGDSADPQDAETALMLADAQGDDALALEMLLKGLDLVGDDDVLEYRVRMRIVARAGEVGHVEQAVEHFDWCVHHNDLDPARFPAQIDDEDLLQFYTWIPAILMELADIPRERVLESLDAMEQRWLREGMGLSMVLEERFVEAFRSGRPDEAQEYLEAIAGEPDDAAPCETCLQAEQVEFLLDVGEEAEALEAFDDLIESEESCDREPEVVMGRVLLPLMRAGRPDDAVKAHWLGYQLVRHNDRMLPTIAQHLEFCAATGNTGRAVALLERHLPDLFADFTDAFQFHSLLCIGVACEALSVQQAGSITVNVDRNVTTELLGMDADVTPTVASLGAAARALALAHAKQFDRRNGTDRYTRLVREANGRVLRSYPQPLGTVESMDLPDVSESVEPTDVDGWLQEVAWAGTSSDQARRNRAVTAALALEPTPAQRLKLYSMVASAAYADADPATLEHAVKERVAAYRELGLEDAADVEAEHGVMLSGVLDNEQAVLVSNLLKEVESSDETSARLLEDVALHLLHAGDQDESYKLYLAAADAAQRTNDLDMVRTCLVGACWAVPLDAEDGQVQARLLDSIEEMGPWANQAYDVGYLRAVDQLAVQNDPEAALATATRARDLALKHRAAQPLLQISRFISEVQSQLDRDRSAAQTMHVYVRSATRMGVEPDIMARVEEGKFLANAGLNYAALEALDETRRVMEQRVDHSPAEWASLERWNGNVAMALGFIGTAVECYDRAVQDGEKAIAEAPEVEDAQQAAFLGCQSARSIVTLAEQTGHPEDVRNFGERALSLAELIHDHERGLLAVTRAQVGRAWVRLGDETGLQLLLEAEQEARADGEDWFAAEALDSRGRALLELDNSEEAIPLLLSAADQFNDQGDQLNAALSEYAAGATLKDQGRAQEALSILVVALDRIKDLERTNARSTIAGLVVELLDEAGRSAEADDLRGLV